MRLNTGIENRIPFSYKRKTTIKIFINIINRRFFNENNKKSNIKTTPKSGALSKLIWQDLNALCDLF